MWPGKRAEWLAVASGVRVPPAEGCRGRSRGAARALRRQPGRFRYPSPHPAAHRASQAVRGNRTAKLRAGLQRQEPGVNSRLLCCRSGSGRRVIPAANAGARCWPGIRPRQAADPAWPRAGPGPAARRGGKPRPARLGAAPFLADPDGPACAPVPGNADQAARRGVRPRRWPDRQSWGDPGTPLACPRERPARRPGRRGHRGRAAACGSSWAGRPSAAGSFLCTFRPARC